MRFLKILTSLLFFCALHTLYVSAAQITHTVTYDPDNLTLSYDTINDIYTIVEYDGLLSYNFAGSPKLPTDILTFSVPYNAKNFRVQMQTNTHYDIPLVHHVYPQQESMPIDQVTVSDFTEPDQRVYGSFDFEPRQTSTVLCSGFLLGDNQVVSIRIHPFTYNPKYKIVRLATNATVTVSYDVDTTFVPSLVRYNLEVKETEMESIVPQIVNGYYMALNSYAFNMQNQGSSQVQESWPTYTYCIITSRDLEPAFKKIVAMKRQKGISTGVVCVEDLMSSPIFNTGDNMGNNYATITDTAGVIREYLKYAFQSPTNPTQYVLMGGKAPFAPVRYAKSPYQKWPSWQHVPSDLYFSDLSMPWVHVASNYDDIFQSEYEIPASILIDRAIPYYPDLFIGRLLCSNKEEIDNYSRKLYKYTFSPGDGDTSYLLNALVVSANDSNIRESANNYISWVDGMFADKDLTLSHIENSDSDYMTGSQALNHINENKCGYLSLYGHGEPQSIEIYNNGQYRYIISALDSYIADTIGSTPEITNNEICNGLDNLNNKLSPFICYSISCSIMPYDIDPTFNKFTTYENKYNFGESFTLGNNYGGPAFLGNTRMGYFNKSEYLEAEFINTLLNRQLFSPGKAEAYSKVFFKLKSDNVFNHITLEHNLLGDPEFDFWTSEPQKYDDVVVSYYEGSFIITGLSPNDTVAYCDNNGSVGKRIGDNFVAILGVSPTTTLMVYNHHHIPYIAPMKLQHCDINNSQYVYASAFAAGRNVLPANSPGDVFVKSGAIYEVEATDDVHLGEGFIVENGATFAIKTPGKVTIDGCVFQSGAKVKIEAGNVEIVKNCTAERGSKVEITQYID